MRHYNVLSLFGGIETGYAALKDAGIPVECYCSSEIDKHAITVTKWNYPKVVHIGDVKGVVVANLPFVPDLLLAGFPCQDLSVAGKGAGLEGERSGLFFEAVRILRECQAVNRNVLFLFENVPMAKRHERVINETLGLSPWKNCASLVSAQTRKRLWWSNIRTKKTGLFGDVVTDFPQPKDMGIMLTDILESDVDEKYYLSGAALARIDRSLYSSPKINPEKSGTINCKNNSGQLSIDSGTTLIGVVNDNGTLRRVEKSNSIDANFHKGMDNHGQRTLAVVVAHNMMPRNGKGQGGKGHLQKTDGKSYCCDTGNTNAVEVLPGQIRPRYFDSNGKKHYGKTGDAQERTGYLEFNSDLNKSGTFLAANNKVNVIYRQDRINYSNGKARPAPAGTHGNAQHHTETKTGETPRRLTPVEVCRLFTLPDDLFQTPAGPIVAQTHRYRLLGNGWVMKVVSHIFSFLPELK